ncbi:hypothetical protein ACFPH6_35935, partial [Streptomyces xiangluensis]
PPVHPRPELEDPPSPQSTSATRKGHPFAPRTPVPLEKPDPEHSHRSGEHHRHTADDQTTSSPRHSLTLTKNHYRSLKRQQFETPAASPWAAVGVSAFDELLYQAILHQPDAGAGGWARLTDAAPAEKLIRPGGAGVRVVSSAGAWAGALGTW